MSLSLLTDPVFFRAFLGGILLAMLAGPLGCFVVWRRMAYFGDALAHASIFGVGIGLLIGVGAYWGLIAVAIIATGILLLLEQRTYLATDTLLGVLAHGGLGLGLVLISLSGPVPGGLEGFLFGDILALSTKELWIMGGATLIGLILLISHWHHLIGLTLHTELSTAEGAPALRSRLIFMGLVALTVAIGVKAVGALLISALLVMPAAAARGISSSPEQMAVRAALAGIICAIGGLGLSLMIDVPAGPAIIVIAVGLFVLSLLAGTSAIRR